VRVTFTNLVLTPDSTTRMFISIRDAAGEEGSAEVSLLAPPAPPFVTTTIDGVEVSDSTVQNVTLSRGIELVGVVTTTSGIPVPNLSLHLEGAADVENGEGPAPLLSGVTTSNDQGIYRFAREPGTYTLFVRPPFKDELEVGVIELRAAARRDVVLEDLFQLSGVVRDQRGEAQAFGNVSARNTDNRIRGSGFSQLDREGTYAMFLPGGVYRVTASTSLGLEAPPPADGSRVAAVPEAAFAPDFPPAPPSISFPTVIEEVEVRADTTLDIAIPDVFLLAGEITDQRGDAVARARVSAQSQDQEISSSATSDEDGKYTLALPAGAYDLTISPPTRRLMPPQVGSRLPDAVLSPAATRLTGVVVSEDAVQDIVLPDGLFLSGRVTDEDGEPVVRASVTATDVSAEFTAFGATNADGLYLLALPPGTYSLTVTPSRGPIVIAVPRPLPEPLPGFIGADADDEIEPALFDAVIAEPDRSSE
jgi:hypothetical protein